jgi:transketolase
MEQPVVYVFTHDGIGVGEDGPTHEPIEQLAMLRATPNVVVIRPADGNESAVAWKVAIERTNGPTALILSRQKLPSYDRSVCGSADGVRRGGYVLQEAEGAAPQVVLVGTGSEVAIAMSARNLLSEKGIRARVVSLPSWELFDAQPKAYRDDVLPPGVPRVTIEAGASIGWHKYAGDNGIVLALDRFGASAPAERIYAELGLTPEAMAAAAESLLA